MELVIDGIIIEDTEILSKVDELLLKDKALKDIVSKTSHIAYTYDKAYDLALAYEDLESLLLEKLGIEKDFLELVKFFEEMSEAIVREQRINEILE